MSGDAPTTVDVDPPDAVGAFGLSQHRRVEVPPPAADRVNRLHPIPRESDDVVRGHRPGKSLQGQFADGLVEIQRFTTTWISEHA